MDQLHSLLMLLDLSISCDAPKARMDSDLAGVKELQKRMGVLKQQVMRHKQYLDYHAIECESMLSFLTNKLVHLYLDE